MEAELKATGIDVALEDSARKDISFDRPTEWFWDLKANGAGSPATLTLTLSGQVKVGGVERMTPVEPFPVHYEFPIASPPAPSSTQTSPQQSLPARKQGQLQWLKTAVIGLYVVLALVGLWAGKRWLFPIVLTKMRGGSRFLLNKPNLTISKLFVPLVTA